MKKATRNTIIALTALILILAAAFLLYPRSAPASRMTPQELIDYTLESMDAADAVLDTEEMARQEQAKEGLDVQYLDLIYRDPSDQTQYFFREDTGRLSMVRHEDDTGDPSLWDSGNDPSEEERETLARAYAQKLVLPYRIGELRLEWFQDCMHRSNEDRSKHRTAYRYHYQEYLNDLPTGTAVYVEIWAQGDIDSGSLYVGEIFQPNLFGSYSPKNGTDFIPMETAEELGFQEVSADYSDAPYEISTKLVAYRDSFAYEVNVEDTDPNNPICHTSTILIDAYSGEILDVMRCA